MSFLLSQRQNIIHLRVFDISEEASTFPDPGLKKKNTLSGLYFVLKRTFPLIKSIVRNHLSLTRSGSKCKFLADDIQKSTETYSVNYTLFAASPI